jgi:SAM-dependent methyltransferase
MDSRHIGSHLDRIRQVELDIVLEQVGDRVAGRDLLEIGCGRGAQLAQLQKICRTVEGVETDPQANVYSEVASRVHIYDGAQLPFADNSFDVIYSSNVLEHVSRPDVLSAEMHRVMRAGGIAVHVLPSHTWRLWTMLVHYLALPRDVVRALAGRRWAGTSLQGGDEGGRTPAGGARWLARALLAFAVSPRHGESGNRFTEYFLFRPAAWTRKFTRQGWLLEYSAPVEIFYTGNALLGDHISLALRRRLARAFGASSWFYVLRPRLGS